ncbi:unnamed protein product [Camellia sinensis]
MNQTIVEKIRCMLKMAKLPKPFWGEAVRVACYLINRSPSVLLNFEIPEKVWSGREISYSHLRLFGCKAFAHVSKEHRQKLDDKATPCIFIDHATNDVELQDGFLEEEDPEEEGIEQGEPQPPPPETVGPQLRRSTRESKPSSKYPTSDYILLTDEGEPESFQEAQNHKEKNSWHLAMQEEMQSLQKNQTYDLDIYKGKLTDGGEIAVKKPLVISEKGKELVLNEMKLLLGSAHHRNIEFASNGSLDYLLFNSEACRADALDWKRTYAIIIGVARGLLYLHKRSHNVIIHCDIKPTNILIDENWVPKMADFGTANLFPQDQMHVNISEATGTLGEFDLELRPTMDRVYSMLLENHSNSSTLVNEPMRDGSSSSSSTTRNSDANKGKKEALQEIINNTKLSEGYLTLAHDTEVMEPKSPEDIYKAHLLNGRASAGASVDSARQSLAAIFVNAFVNAGFGQDKLMTVPSKASSGGSSGNWLFKNKEHGKVSAAACLGMILLWDVDSGLAQLDKYFHSNDNHVIAGALLGVGIVNCGIKNNYDPVNKEDSSVRVGAIMGLGLAYAGAQNEQIEPDEGPVRATIQEVAVTTAAAKEEEDEEGIPIAMITKEDPIETLGKLCPKKTSARQPREKTPLSPPRMTKQTKEAAKKVANQQQTIEEEVDEKSPTTLNDTEERPVNSTPEDSGCG